MDLILSISEDFVHPFVLTFFVLALSGLSCPGKSVLADLNFSFAYFSAALFRAFRFSVQLFSSASSRGIISPKKKPRVVPTKLKCTRQARLTQRRPRVKGHSRSGPRIVRVLQAGLFLAKLALPGRPIARVFRCKSRCVENI